MATAAATAAEEVNPYANCKQKVYSYKAPWNTYSLAWSNSLVQTDHYRIAVGSFIERYENSVDIIQLDPQLDRFVKKASIQHAYPTTKLQWAPSSMKLEGRDMLATVGDYLRLWSIPTTSSSSEPDGAPVSLSRPEKLLDGNKTKNSCTPLTSMDWNPLSPNIIGQCCIDPIVTIWDIEAEKIKSKILAHGSSVFDIKFKPTHESIFATVGADGSLRLFDLRNLQHSAICFESEQKKPLIRLDWNHGQAHIAVLDVDGMEVNVLDLRQPMKPLYTMKRHAFPVNAIAWAPHSDIHIATAGEDKNAFIWNLESERFKDSGDPLLEYCSGGCINNMVWSSSQPDWLSIAFDDTVQILLV